MIAQNIGVLQQRSQVLMSRAHDVAIFLAKVHAAIAMWETSPISAEQKAEAIAALAAKMTALSDQVDSVQEAYVATDPL